MTQTIGNVAFVLNAHFPYVRRAGRWPHGEESLHTAIAESYVPLLVMLYDLRSVAPGGVPITLSISPILLEQLADPVLTKHFTVWLDEWRSRARLDLTRFEAAGDGHAAYLARFYCEWIDGVEQTVVERFGRNLAAAIRRLPRETTEFLLSPATHAYLPQLTPPELRAQLDVAALVLLRQLGRRPAGLWLPGGGVPDADSAALQLIARDLNVRYGVGAPAARQGTVQQPNALAVLHADNALLEHVLAPSVGYPGDALYREFYRPHPASGIHYWRVTGVDVPLEAKQWYDPYLAFSRAEEHADHFVRALRAYARAAAGATPTPIVLTFDAELFGHWWFEGGRWLQSVLQRLLTAEDLALVTLDQIQASLPVIEAPAAGTPHPIFHNAAATALRAGLHAAAAHVVAVIQQYPLAEGLQDALLCQAARELLLAQSSDWAALIVSGAARDYAQRRFDEHLTRLERLLYYVECPEVPPDAETYLHEIAELDNPFPYINYRIFG